jgi:hypothetical protein
METLEAERGAMSSTALAVTVMATAPVTSIVVEVALVPVPVRLMMTVTTGPIAASASKEDAPTATTMPVVDLVMPVVDLVMAVVDLVIPVVDLMNPVVDLLMIASLPSLLKKNVTDVLSLCSKLLVV